MDTKHRSIMSATPGRAPDQNLNPEMQLILDAVVEGVCGIDADGKATFCNEAFLTMTGYCVDELIGHNMHLLLHHSRPNGAPIPMEECEFSKAVLAGRATRVVGESLWRKNGTCFPSEYWLRPISQPYMGTGFVLTIKDITDVEEARKVLFLSEERFRRILASTPDIAWTSDRNGHMVYVSPKVEAILGYTKQEICSEIGLWVKSIHPDDLAHVSAAYAALFEKKAVFDEEYRIRRKDGSWVWVHNRATGIHEENGSLYAHGFLSDVTERKQAEQALQFQTAVLEAQVNCSIDGILVVDCNGRWLLNNQRLLELLNIPEQVCADKDDSKILNYVMHRLKDPQAFLAKVKDLYEHPDQKSRDELELTNGTILDRYSAPVVDKNGKHYGRVWMFRDITERKHTEDALRQLSLAVEQSPVSVVITDPQGTISYVNRKFTDMTGYSAEESVGKNPRILKSGHNSVDLYKNLWSTINQGKVWRGELCNKKKNGEIFWEAATITPMTDPKGAVTHFLAVKEDITERRRAECDLRLTQFSIEHASDMIQWTESNGHIVYANRSACSTLGRSREEMLHLSISDICPNFSLPAWERFWEELKVRRSMTFETQLQTKSIEIFGVEMNANYLQFDGHEYCFASARDVRERRALEAQLRQAQKLEGIGQLAAGIAHEINTPTQFVTDNLTFLRDSWKSAEQLLGHYRGAIKDVTGALPAGIVADLQQAEKDCDLEFITKEVPLAIDQSLDGARRVAKIVRAMKEFSHPDSAEKTATDLNQAIESTITVARNEWKYVSEIVTQFNPSLPAVVCYPGDINQVVLNLIVNAAHAIREKVKEGEKGKITVATRTCGDSVEISVADTGTGIPAAIQAKVFDPFFTTKEVGKGTGQGLALAYSVVVKKHGGKIWFETEMGNGTTFFFTLPVTQPGSAH